MAILTWRDIAIPDIARASQEGIRNAGEMFSRATQNAQGGVQQLQAMELARQKEEVENADRSALNAMLSAQTPEQLEAMRQAGTLLGDNPNKVSLDTLKAADQRDVDLYTRDRTRTQDAQNDELVRRMGIAAILAPTDPTGAQAELEGLDAPIESMLATRSLLGNLHVRPQQERTASASDFKRMDESLAASAFRTYQQVGPDNPEGQNAIIDEVYQVSPIAGRMLQELVAKSGLGDINTQGRANEQLVQDFVRASNVGPESAFGYMTSGQTDQYMNYAKNTGDLFPGSPEWRARNSNRDPTHAELADWQNRARVGTKTKSSAEGPYQIVGNTRAKFSKKVWGDVSAPRTILTERQLSKEIWNSPDDPDGGPKAWEALHAGPNGERFKGYQFEQVDGLIQFAETGTLPYDFEKELKRAEQLYNQDHATLSQNPLFVAYDQMQLKGTETLDDAVAKVYNHLKGGAKELKVGEINRAFNEIKKAHPTLNSSEIATIFTKNVQNAGFWNAVNLGKNLDTVDGQLKKDADAIIGIRSSWKAHDQVKKNLEENKKLREQLLKARNDAVADWNQNKKNRAGTPTTVRKWNRVQQLVGQLADKFKKPEYSYRVPPIQATTETLRRAMDEEPKNAPQVGTFGLDSPSAPAPQDSFTPVYSNERPARDEVTLPDINFSVDPTVTPYPMDLLINVR